MDKNNNNPEEKSLGGIIADVTVDKLFKAAKKNERSSKESGIKKVAKVLGAGEKIDWRCGACGGFIKYFIGKDGVKDIRYQLKVFKDKGYTACPKYGKKHLNRFSIKNDEIIFETKLAIKGEKTDK